MNRPIPAKAGERGAELVEFAFVMLPLFFFVFAIFSIAWILFAQASLQYAVREGCRYAVTGANPATPAVTLAIQQRVQQNSFGFIASTELNNISVSAPTSTGVFTVTASKTISIIGGFLFSANSITLTASSSDAMENTSLSN